MSGRRKTAAPGLSVPHPRRGVRRGWRLALQPPEDIEEQQHYKRVEHCLSLPFGPARGGRGPDCVHVHPTPQARTSPIPLLLTTTRGRLIRGNCNGRSGFQRILRRRTVVSSSRLLRLPIRSRSRSRISSAGRCRIARAVSSSSSSCREGPSSKGSAIPSV